MALQAFSFPVPETRFIQAGRTVYKFKIRAGSSFSGKKSMGGNVNNELEDIIRTVLGNLNRLQPFSSAHFNVFPYKKQWEGASKVMSKHRKKALRAFPFTLILYVEKNAKNAKQADEKQSATRGCTPESATLKGLSEEVEAGNKVSPARSRDLNSNMVEPQRKRFHKFTNKSPVLLPSRDRWLNMENPQLEEGPHEMETDKLRNAQTEDDAVAEAAGPANVPSGKTEEAEAALLGDEEGGDADARPDNCEGSGILTWLASHIFPWLFREE